MGPPAAVRTAFQISGEDVEAPATRAQPARSTSFSLERNPCSGRARAASADKTRQQVKIDVEMKRKLDCIGVLVARSDELLEPPAPYRLVPRRVDLLELSRSHTFLPPSRVPFITLVDTRFEVNPSREGIHAWLVRRMSRRLQRRTLAELALRPDMWTRALDRCDAAARGTRSSMR